MYSEPLAIEKLLPDLKKALQASNSAVLVAEPGAGKTTKVPLFLLQSEWLGKKKILMLEPRRLAARSAVYYMAQILGEKVGETLGYRVRGESRVSSKTRVEVVTEGILTRIIQSQPDLEDVGLIIFDEFHERSLNADLALALALEVQKTIRPDLRILVMSATLDAQAVADLIGAKSIIHSLGRNYPVEIKFLSEKSKVSIVQLVAEQIKRVLLETDGDILVFLPGRAEIEKVLVGLSEKPFRENIKVLPLYSDLPFSQQDLVLNSRSADSRKIILATSIAETSLTIPGIKIVIDSGLMRVPRFDPSRGMSSLETVSVSQASAKQRAGRAGRESAGVCYRLWTESQHRELPAFNQPEILQSDLSSLALELAVWGQQDPEEFNFLTQPSKANYQQARSLLKEISAINSSGKITAHGHELSKLGVHPRIAHMLLKAKELQCLEFACDIAALLEEKKILDQLGNDIEISARWHALEQFRRQSTKSSNSILSRVDKESKRLKTIFGVSSRTSDKQFGLCGVLVALAYPERIAKRRESYGNRYLLRNGTGALLPDNCLLSKYEYLAVAHLDSRSTDSKIFLCESLDLEDIRSHFLAEMEIHRETTWDSDSAIVKSREKEKLGALIINEKSIPVSNQEALSTITSFLRDSSLQVFPWENDAEQVIARSEWLRKSGLIADTSWPRLDIESLVLNIESWLSPYLEGISSYSELCKIDLTNILLNMFDWKQKKILEQSAPKYLELVTGTKVRIDYLSPSGPLVSVRLQELLGQSETPKIAEGKVDLTLEILSPARRPLQTTKDLASFWRNSYQEVRKEMQGRYPKHFWPIDPLAAKPTSRTKAKSS